VSGADNNNLWLAGHTQQEIENKLSVSQPYVVKITKNITNGKIANHDIFSDFTPFIYTNWNIQKLTEFISVEDFLNAPYPYGLGSQVEKIGDRFLPLGQQGGDRRSNKFQPVNSQVDYGTGNKSYILARLERDHPQILADYHLGKYRSIQTG